MGHFSIVSHIMAYSSVRVQFEIGHEASVRTKKTPEGFTHDWEVFVRGADNTDIQCFVDKVVFHLHETFPKPRRVIKEPPYLVKESGYAGFVLPIDVYLKNKEEPKKISFQYDLHLQPSGPPISRVLREPRLFQNPSEDFRRKLIRGGGVGVDTPSEIHTDDLKSAAVGINKLKVVDSPSKKQKTDLPPNDSFAELFGTPIRRIIEPKKITEAPRKLTENDSAKDKKKISRHNSCKDEKELLKEKEKYLEKDRSRDRDKVKEKPRRPLTPPSLISQISKAKDEHKKHEERRREDYDDKKRRREEKDKKERPKETEKQVERDQKKDKKDAKDNDFKKMSVTKVYEVKANYEKQTNVNLEKEKHKHRHKKKEKEKNRDKDKPRKDKDKNEKESKEREKNNGKRRSEGSKEKEEKLKKRSRTPSPVHQERLKKKPLNALLDELGSSDSASPLSEDDGIPSFKMLSKPTAKIVPETKLQPIVNVNPKLQSTNLNVLTETRAEKEYEKISKLGENNPLKNQKEKFLSKKNKKFEKDIVKRKETKEDLKLRSSSTDREEESTEKEKLFKDERERSEKGRPLDEKLKTNNERENRKRKRDKNDEVHLRHLKSTVNQENCIASSQSAANCLDETDDFRKPDKFTKEYVAQLKDLQHRIMTLDDNAELQKVVKVIAETGQYEVTKKTFDFDLCALDFETVKRLQEFFSPT